MTNVLRITNTTFQSIMIEILYFITPLLIINITFLFGVTTCIVVFNINAFTTNLNDSRK